MKKIEREAMMKEKLIAMKEFENRLISEEVDYS